MRETIWFLSYRHRGLRFLRRRSDQFNALIGNTIIMVCFFVTSSTAYAAECADFDAHWTRLVTHVSDIMSAEGDVGGSLYITSNGKVLRSKHFGYADIDEQIPVDANTIYHWASITKTFTSIAVMQLRERKLLSLDDPIVKYLPELRKIHNPYGQAEQITLRHLISHSSGLRSPTWPWGGEAWMPYEPTEWSQLVSMAPYTEIEFKPGSRFGYSNPATILLGRVIEILTGDDIEVYIDKNILKPLGMYWSYFDITPYFLKAYRSNNYTIIDGQAVADGIDFDTGITTANGGLNGPISDLVRYVHFLTGTGDNSNYDIVLRRTTLEEMWEPILPTATNASDMQEHVATGFFVIDFDGGQKSVRRYVGHTGSQKGFRSFFYIDNKLKVSVIWATNTTTPDNSGDVPGEIRRRIFSDIFPRIACN